MVRANNLEEASQSKTYTLAPDGTMTLISETPPTQNHDIERYFGYGVIGLFGASALYGFFMAKPSALRFATRSEAKRKRTPSPWCRRVKSSRPPPCSASHTT